MPERCLKPVLSVKCHPAGLCVLDIAVILGGPEPENWVGGEVFLEIDEQAVLLSLKNRDYVLHLKLYMAVVSYYGPVILCPCHRSHEGLTAECGQRYAGVPACGKENCNPSVVSDINQICMPCALYVMALPAGMRQHWVERTLLIGAVDIAASQGAYVMSHPCPALGKDQVIPAFTEVDVRSLGRASAAAC